MYADVLSEPVRIGQRNDLKVFDIFQICPFITVCLLNANTHKAAVKMTILEQKV